MVEALGALLAGAGEVGAVVDVYDVCAVVACGVRVVNARVCLVVTGLRASLSLVMASG